MPLALYTDWKNVYVHNDRFTQAPTFQLEDTRVPSNDWVTLYDTRDFQVARQNHVAPARSTALVREAVTVRSRFGTGSA